MENLPNQKDVATYLFVIRVTQCKLYEQIGLQGDWKIYLERKVLKCWSSRENWKAVAPFLYKQGRKLT